MIRLMSKSSVPLLLAGFLAGFLAVYLAVRDRDPGPVVIRDPALLSQLTAPSGPASTATREMALQLETRLTGAPSDLPILTDLASLNWDLSDFAQAAMWYRRALGIAPEDPDLRTDLGTVLFLAGNPEEAIGEFAAALQLDPVHPQGLINFGIVLLEARQDTAGARAVWERFLQAHPAHPSAAMVREELGKLGGGQ
jgi:Flp pilus assembly protein TadD